MASLKKKISVLILAAGASSRMGRPKQLLPWKKTTLLGNAIQNAIASEADTVYVVLGANIESIRDEITNHPVETVDNPNWESGLGSSIAAGVTFILKNNIEFDGILIMLADQPLMDTEYLNMMIDTFYRRPESIVATAYRNKAGVPALFDKAYNIELVNLNKDFGAKALIAQKINQVFTINPENKVVDIDTKSEYDKLIKNIK